MAIIFIIPTLAVAGEKAKQLEPVLETSKTTMGSEVINQEVIQILRTGDWLKIMKIDLRSRELPLTNGVRVAALCAGNWVRG